MDDNAIELITRGIGNINKQNMTLLHLNLSNNIIGDRGAEYVAKVILML